MPGKVTGLFLNECSQVLLRVLNRLKIFACRTIDNSGGSQFGKFGKKVVLCLAVQIESAFL